MMNQNSDISEIYQPS